MNMRSSVPALVSRTAIIALALMLVAVITFAGTRAVFSDTTANSGNSFATADIELTDNDSGSALFAVSDMFPGDTAVGCIDVTYTGPAGKATNGVNIYVSGYTDSASLGDDLNVTVEEGSGAAGFDDCTGFTSSATIATSVALSSFGTDYGTGYGTWTPSSSGTTSYRITVELDSSSTAEGESVTALEFTWEVQAG